MKNGIRNDQKINDITHLLQVLNFEQKNWKKEELTIITHLNMKMMKRLILHMIQKNLVNIL